MFIDSYADEINGLCKMHKVKSLSSFGSVLTGNFSTKNDVDFVVDINSADPIDYAENYFEFKFNLQKLLSKPIDLLEKKNIKDSHLLESINKTKVLYETRGSDYTQPDHHKKM